MSSSMDLLSFLFFTWLCSHPRPVRSQNQYRGISSRITVVGVVYCDACSSNIFSRHSYFLSGAEVHISCRFRANSPRTSEVVNISVNRTTDRKGVYQLEIPHIDGVDCVDGMAIASQCEAHLIRSPSRACRIPLLKSSTNEISVKSKQDKMCIYSLSALSYRPSRINKTLCGAPTQEENIKNKPNLKESKFFWPYLPPYWFPWPESFPFNQPSTAVKSKESQTSPDAAVLPFDWRDPRTWAPYFPASSPPKLGSREP